MAPWQLVNAVSMAVAVRFFPLLLLCCWMVSREDGSDVVDGMSASASPLARDGLGYHGHDNGIDRRGRQSQAILYLRRSYLGMYHLALSQKHPVDLSAAEGSTYLSYGTISTSR